MIVGNIDPDTIDKVLKTDIADYIRNLKEKDANLEKQINFYFYRQELRRKNISDVVEALIGVYLKVERTSFNPLKLESRIRCSFCCLRRVESRELSNF